MRISAKASTVLRTKTVVPKHFSLKTHYFKATKAPTIKMPKIPKAKALKIKLK